MLSAARPTSDLTRGLTGPVGSALGSRLVRSASRPAQRGSTAVGAQSQVADVAVGAARRAEPAQSARHSGAAGSSSSTSSRTIGRRSSWSPSIGKASSDVGWTWYSSWTSATSVAGRRTAGSAGTCRSTVVRDLAVDDDAVAQALEDDVDDDRRPVGDLRVAAEGQPDRGHDELVGLPGAPAAAAARRR